MTVRKRGGLILPIPSATWLQYWNK